MQKLKNVQRALIVLKKKGFHDIEAQVYQAKEKLNECQTTLHKNPRDPNLRATKLEASDHYKEKQQAHLLYLFKDKRQRWNG